jgi:hypothetical protein
MRRESSRCGVKAREQWLLSGGVRGNAGGNQQRCTVEGPRNLKQAPLPGLLVDSLRRIYRDEPSVIELKKRSDGPIQ